MVFIDYMPLWAWYFVGFIFCFGIYQWVLDEKQKAGAVNFFKTWGFYIALLLLWFYMRSSLGFFNDGEWFNRKANAFALFILMLFFLGVNFLGRERYKSTHAVVNNRSGCCAEYEFRGDYVILNIGSIDSDLIPWSFGHETWVVPKRHFKKINNKSDSSKTQIVLPTIVSKSDMLEIPSVAADFIESERGYNKENIYYGEFTLDEIQSGKKLKDDTGQDLDMTTYENKMKDINRMLNESRTMLKGKTSSIKNFVSDASAIRKKAEGKSLIAPEREERV